jgi:hypothetical protein
VLAGYEDFRDFDRRELQLIEALRTLRLIHYSAWIARRWDDPAFPAAFPWFNTQRYWQDRVLELREQIALMQEPALEEVGRRGLSRRRLWDVDGIEVGAANADRRRRRPQPVGVAIQALADQSGHRAQATLQQREDEAVLLRLLARELVALDAHLGVRPQRDLAAVGHVELRVGVALGGHHVADLHLRFLRQQADAAVGALHVHRAREVLHVALREGEERREQRGRQQRLEGGPRRQPLHEASSFCDLSSSSSGASPP